MAGAKGERTRGAILDAAFDLFSTRGFAATSLRDIAERVGVNKAALYYYFPGKQAILESLFGARIDETAEVLAWVRQQPVDSDLARRTVLRWIDGASAEKLRGIRFINANPGLGGASGERIGEGIEAVVTAVAAGRTGADLLQLRMAFLSLNAAIAAAGPSFTDDEIIHAARETAQALLT